MEKYHRPIASITLQHEFYVDKNLHAATIVPFPETALFFKNYRIIFKRKSHYYVLLQEAEVESNIATIPATSQQIVPIAIRVTTERRREVEEVMREE